MERSAHPMESGAERAHSGLAGDRLGRSVEYGLFWRQWVGQSVPWARASSESLGHYRNARRRARPGLRDPLVCSRHLLWSLFGSMQICTLLVFFPPQFHRSWIRSAPLAYRALPEG